jgi:phenylacetate-coenzyme A ligase PaaK-like adenylate-forming protein
MRRRPEQAMRAMPFTFDVRKELQYGGRSLLRDNIVCRRRVRRLIEHERLSADELGRMTDALLLRSLRHAVRRLPAYREISLSCEVPDVRDWLREHWPIIGREDLLSRRSELYPYSGNSRPWVTVGKTSGTTGTPLTVFRSADSVLWEHAFIERHLSWCGYEPGMRRAYLRGDLVVPVERGVPPFWFYNRYNRQLIVSSRHLYEPYIESIAEAFGAFAPRILQAYPSTAYALASYLEQYDQYLSIPYVYTSSEPLYPHQRDVIERRLRARVLDHYGMAERIAFAGECEHGNLHVNSDYSYVELVDEQGRPAVDEGFVVGTTFHNSVMPLVRYRVSDRTKWRRGTCACGRPCPMIEPVTGKYEDAVFGSRGQPISRPVVSSAFKGLAHVKQSQVAQVGDGRWEIRVVPLQGFDAEERERLIRNIRNLVDPDLHVEVTEVADIPRMTSAKYKWIVNESHGAAGRS